jgi:tetratricopeptide (TPR) repeat protein
MHRVNSRTPTMAADAADELVLLGRAFELQQAGQLRGRTYAQVLAANPDDATALVNAGALHWPAAILDSRSRAERVVARADNAPARSNLGFALIRAGRDSEALAVLDRAVVLNGAFAQAHNNRGIALARLGRTADAIALSSAHCSSIPATPSRAQSRRPVQQRVTRIAQPPLRPRARRAAGARRCADRAGVRASARGDLAGAIDALGTITTNHPACARWQTLGAVRNWAWDTPAPSAHSSMRAVDAGQYRRAIRDRVDLLARGDFERVGVRSSAAGSRRRIRPRVRACRSGMARRSPDARRPWRAGLRRRRAVRALRATARARVGRVVLLLDGYGRRSRRCSFATGVDEVVTASANIQ